MKITIIRFKTDIEKRTAKPQGGMLYDLENEEEKKEYIKDICKLEEGYIYNISIVKEKKDET